MAKKGNRFPKAKKVFIQLHEPFKAYASLEDALKRNPDTVKSDWHKFDSGQEYERYTYLLACQNEGLIFDLIPHPATYEVVPQLHLPKNGIRTKKRTKSRRVYTPDFRYRCNAYPEVDIYEDYKGYKATASASLQHTLFVHMLFKADPSGNFHFKVVKSVTDSPLNE